MVRRNECYQIVVALSASSATNQRSFTPLRSVQDDKDRNSSG
ncbi:MAG: hypothetical protein Q8N21_01640 [bacterium]|nr:hypothetical protein [bacterium]